MAEGDSGVSNLERSAFWIYGVTAMIMREPLGSMLRHAGAAGWSDWQVRVELLRTLVVLSFLSRLFLAAGLHFETVYMRSGAGARYPRRSYPVDFLAGLIQLLIGVAASTTIAQHPAREGDTPVFTILAGIFLLSDVLWLAITALLRFSATREVATRAAVGAAILAISMVLNVAARAAGTSPVSADLLALITLLLLTFSDAAVLIRRYGHLDSVQA